MITALSRLSAGASSVISAGTVTEASLTTTTGGPTGESLHAAVETTFVPAIRLTVSEMSPRPPLAPHEDPSLSTQVQVQLLRSKAKASVTVAPMAREGPVGHRSGPVARSFLAAAELCKVALRG